MEYGVLRFVVWEERARASHRDPLQEVKKAEVEPAAHTFESSGAGEPGGQREEGLGLLRSALLPAQERQRAQVESAVF